MLKVTLSRLLAVALRMHLTLITIVCTINVSIDCKKNKVSNLNQEKNILDCKLRQQVAWFVFRFRAKLCAKMMFSLLVQLQILNGFVP